MPARLVRGNVSARLVVDELGQLEREAATEWFDEYCTFEIPTFVRTRQMRHAKRRVEKVRLFAESTGKFPGGLLEMARRRARSDAMDAIACGEWDLAPLARLRVEDTRAPPVVPEDPARWPQLAPWLYAVLEDGRDYRFQLDAAQRVLERVNGILEIPTGGGKTEVAVGLARVVPCRWLFLVPSKDLLEQAAARYERLTGDQAGRVGDGRWTVGRRFTVGTLQTLARRLKARDEAALELVQRWAQGLVVDEVHQLPADTFYAVAMECRSAYWRVGISATPLARGDRRSALAVAAIGPVIYRITVPELAARRVISMPTVHMVECVQEFSRPTWQGAYGHGVVRSTQRNRLLADIAARRAARPGILFVKEIDHGRDLQDRLSRAGLRVEFVWGEKAAEVRRAAVRRLERGDRDFVVTSSIWQQGIDIPILRSVVNGAAGRSTIASIQRVGRGTRRDAGKETVEFWDVYDRGQKLLAGWARQRLKAYEAAGFPIVHEIG